MAFIISLPTNSRYINLPFFINRQKLIFQYLKLSCNLNFRDNKNWSSGQKAQNKIVMNKSKQKAKQELATKTGLVPNSHPDSIKKSKIVKEIEKLQQRISNTNSQIQETHKMLDVDLFLKQQKQKRVEYAKNIQAQFEAQKKKRQQKLYRQFNREKRQPQEGQEIQIRQGQEPKVSKQDLRNRSEGLKFLNIPTLQPLSIIKALPYITQKYRASLQWIKSGHHYNPYNIQSTGLRQSQQSLFSHLYKNPSEKPKYDGDFESNHIRWKHIKQVVSNTLQMQIIPSQIQEGSLIPNDANAENILGSILLLKPESSKQTFTESGQIFLAELYSPSEQITVVTDKKIQVRQFTHKYVNLGSRSTNLNIIWPTLAEKCYQKLMTVKNLQHLYSSINKTIYATFGIDPEIVGINNKNVIQQNFHLVLGHLLQEGSIGFMNIGGKSKKVYENRIYPLEKVYLRVQKRGDQQRKQINYKIRNPWRGNLIDSQNLNSFNLLELLELFNFLVIVRDYPKNWVHFRIKVSYFSNGPISITNNEWTKNPQYLFTITKKTMIRIILRNCGAGSQNQAEGKQSVYGFLLFLNKESNNKIEALKMDWLVSKTKSNDIGQASIAIELQRASYILIPYSTSKSIQSYQFYTLDFFLENENYIEFGKARFYDFNYIAKKGSRLNNQKVIQSLEGTEKFQRPKVEKGKIPSKFKQKVSLQVLQSLNLNLFKNARLNNFYVPGLISNLIVNKSIQLQFKKQEQNLRENFHQQLSEQQKAENLAVLLGYDALSEDINQGQMKQIIEQSVGAYDFRDYGLTEEGLILILEVLSQHSHIIELDLSNNNLNDTAITYLCYFMEKNNRTETRRVNIGENPFGKIGRRALEGLKTTFPKLQIFGLK